MHNMQWFFLFANAGLWEVGLKEMKESEVHTLASSALCVDILRGILRVNELEAAMSEMGSLE